MSDDINRCTICLEDMTKGDHLETLPCGHMFHCKCTKSLQKKECPLCRLDIPLLDNIIIQSPPIVNNTSMTSRISRRDMCRHIFILVCIAIGCSSVLILVLHIFMNF